MPPPATLVCDKNTTLVPVQDAINLFRYCSRTSTSNIVLVLNLVLEVLNLVLSVALPVVQVLNLVPLYRCTGTTGTDVVNLLAKF